MNRFQIIRHLAHDVCLTSDVHFDERRFNDFCALIVARAKSVSIHRYNGKLVSAELLFGPVNYCFVDPSSGIEYSYQDGDNTFVRSGALKRIIDTLPQQSMDDFQKLKPFTPDEWVDFMHIRGREHVLYDSEARRRAFNKFLRHLQRHNVQNGSTFIDQYADVFSMCDFLVASECFNDPFLKRAQAVIAGINAYLVNSGLQKLRGIEQLTGLADYRIPQLLVNLGIIVPSAHTLDLMTSGEPVEEGSNEEVVLRSWTIELIDRVAQRIGISAVDADKRMWNLSQELMSEQRLPIGHLRVITNCY